VTPPPFQSFLEAHQARVLRFLVASVGRDDAEECFQETFLAALRAYDRLEEGSNLGAWILTIAQRKAIDAHRSRRRRPVPVGAVAESGEGIGNARAEGDGTLGELVRGLPLKQRSAILWRFAGDLAYRDIAEAAGCSEAAARRRVHIGLKRLREELAR